MSVRTAPTVEDGPMTNISTDRRRFVLSIPTLLMAVAALGCRAGTRAKSNPLARFMALSSLLTGYENLSQRHARIYLEALLADQGRASLLAALYAKAGYGGASPPRTLEDLAARGVFDDERFRALADTITLWWYTGIYDGPAGPTVATYTESLCWRSLTYTIAPSTCGTVGYWAEPPVEK
jgi:D-sorbitol dehydrogenase-like protein